MIESKKLDIAHTLIEGQRRASLSHTFSRTRFFVIMDPRVKNKSIREAYLVSGKLVDGVRDGWVLLDSVLVPHTQ